MSFDFSKERLKRLVGKLCDDRISADEVAELEGFLESHQEARRLYHLAVAVHRDLEACEIPGVVSAAATVADSHGGTGENSGPKSLQPRLHRSRLFVALSIAATLLLMIGYAYLPSTKRPPATPPLATITNLVDVAWSDGEAALRIGDGVQPGRIQFDSGTICFTCAHGVIANIDGPADVEFVSQDHLTLHSGTLVAYVPAGAEGFRVSTQGANVVDLGTEFGVTASVDGTSEIIVFDGEVELSTSDRLNANPQIIAAGLAWQVGKNGIAHPTDFRPAGFEQSRSLLRNRRVIRETFRNDNSFPGSKRQGWSEPWSLDVTNLVVDDAETGIHTINPLFLGAKNYFTFHANAGPESTRSNVKLSRAFESFGQFDLAQPYTIEFVVRFESNPASIQQIRITAESIERSSDATEMWQARASAVRTDPPKLRWRLLHSGDNATHREVLPIVQDRPYRFMVEVDPLAQNWRMTISDGQQTIWNTRRGGKPLRLGTSGKVANVSLRWEIVSDPGADVRFSLDAIRIQNRPTQTQSTLFALP